MDIFHKGAARKEHALTYAVIIALVIGFFFLKPFISLIVVAIIVAYLFIPVYEWLLKKLNNREGAASALTLLITIFAIIVPLLLIAFVTINQATVMVSDASDWVASQNFNSGTPQELLTWVNNFLSNLTGHTVLITQEQVWDQLAVYTSNFVNFVLETLTSWVGSIGSIITNSILYMYVFTAVLVHRKKLVSLFEQLNPLGKDVSKLYLDKSGAMTKGMVKGQFIIAIIQGTESAFVLWLTGMHYFAFFALLLSFMSIIPLGAGIITIPIGIIQILLGNVWQGAVIILNHLLIVTNIDNVLKPVLVPKSVKMQPALTLLAVFAGIAMFGFLGIIIGPVIMILIITTIEVYLRSTEPKTKRLKKNST